MTNLTLTLALIELILKYGPSSAISIIQGLKKSQITPDDIKALIVNPPNSYFTGE